MEETDMAIYNIFERLSAKTDKPYFTMSLVTDDGFVDMGFAQFSRTTGAKALYEQVRDEGLLKEGETEKGAYKMLTVAIEDENLVQIRNTVVIKDFAPIL